MQKTESRAGQNLCLTGQRQGIKIIPKNNMMFSYFLLAEQKASLISDKSTDIKLLLERKRRGKGKDERASSRPQERNE